jgi:CheY-like chemotaxis protein
MELQSSPVKNAVKKQVLNLLLVDDRPENLLTLESILERDDRHIIKASGGNEALRIAIKEEIALVLLDIQMPFIAIKQKNPSYSNYICFCGK